MCVWSAAPQLRTRGPCVRQRLAVGDGYWRVNCVNLGLKRVCTVLIHTCRVEAVNPARCCCWPRIRTYAGLFILCSTLLAAAALPLVSLLCHYRLRSGVIFSFLFFVFDPYKIAPRSKPPSHAFFVQKCRGVVERFLCACVPGCSVFVRVFVQFRKVWISRSAAGSRCDHG